MRKNLLFISHDGKRASVWIVIPNSPETQNKNTKLSSYSYTPLYLFIILSGTFFKTGLNYFGD